MSDHHPRTGTVSLVKAEAAEPAAAPEAEGVLVVALRWPVRVVVLVLVVPVRALWDALVVCGRALRRAVWEPFARGMARLARGLGVAFVWLAKALFLWPWVGVWRYLLAPCGRGLGAVAGWLYRCVLAPTGRGVAAVVRGIGVALAWLGGTLVVRPARWVHRWLLAPLGFGLAEAGLWLYRRVLTPVGHGVAVVVRGLGLALVWLVKALCVWPWVALWRYVLVPVGLGLAWLGRLLLVVPAVALYRYVLTPLGRVLAVLGREIAGAVVICWRLAGRVSRAVCGFLGRVLRVLFVDPVVWVWRHAVRPVGRGVRDHLWRPVADAARGVGRVVRAAVASTRATGRQVRADVRRALFGAPRQPATEPGAGRGALAGEVPAKPTAPPVALQKTAGR